MIFLDSSSLRVVKKRKSARIKIMKILNFVIHVQQLYAHTHAIHMNYSDLTYLISNIHICSRSHEVSFKNYAISREISKRSRENEISFFSRFNNLRSL